MGRLRSQGLEAVVLVTLKSITTESFPYSATRSVADGEVEVQWDSDDPASFQAVYTTETDSEGQEYQLEEQQYIGETSDLLAVIKDLRARVAALEADGGTKTTTRKRKA